MTLQQLQHIQKRSITATNEYLRYIQKPGHDQTRAIQLHLAMDRVNVAYSQAWIEYQAQTGAGSTQ